MTDYEKYLKQKERPAKKPWDVLGEKKKAEPGAEPKEQKVPKEEGVKR